MRALFYKELREHGLVLLLVIGFQLAFIGLLFLYALLNKSQINPHETTAAYMSFLPLLCAMNLGHRLVALEYTGKTQLFLEALPVSRLQVFMVKWLIGLAVLGGLSASAYGLGLLAGLRSQPWDAWYQSIIASRVFVYALFLHCVFFAFGFLGRYRIPLAIICFFAVMTLDMQSDWEVKKLGPLALIFNERFVFERELFPLKNIMITLAMTLGAFMLSLTMALSREGNMASWLGRKMSHREKVFFVVIVISFVVALGVLDERKQKAPYEMTDAVSQADNGVSVHIERDSKLDEQDLEQLSLWLHGELVGLKAYLSLDNIPQVFITQRRDLDPGKYEVASLRHSEGFLLRLHYDPRTWRPRHFLAWLVPHILRSTSEDRVLHEPNRWLLEGFGHFWARRNLADTQADQLLLLRALHGSSRDFSAADTAAWFVFQERVGRDIASACAWFGLDLFSRRFGEEATRSMLHQKLGGGLPSYLRASVGQWRRPLPDLIAQLSGASHQSFIQDWDRELERLRLLNKDSLGGVVPIAGLLEVVNLAQDSHRLRFRLDHQPLLDTAYEFRYVHLPLEDVEIDPEDIVVEGISPGAGTDWNNLPKTYSPGSRIAWSFAYHSSLLDCDVISGWKRLEVQP